VQKILAELAADRMQIEEAILSLERLARGRGRRRGKPPAWLNASEREAPKWPGPPRRPPTTPAGAALALPREWRTVKVWAVSGKRPL